MKLILTCEHGGNEIPPKYSSHFESQAAALNSHRGYDLGTLDLFEHLKQLTDDSYFSTTSRLLIELNRSLHHPSLFSSITKPLSKAEKEYITRVFYTPYRQAVEDKIRTYIQAGQSVAHISVHSFTPILNGKKRDADLGLLFDPSRKAEKQFCAGFREAVKRQDKSLKVRHNYPYLGKADGFATYLRKQFPENYIGIELEVSQKFSTNNIMDSSLKEMLLTALKEGLAAFPK